jgi:hypothetical protein
VQELADRATRADGRTGRIAILGPVNIPGYQILATIGEGGMATALLAVQASLGRKVVLKLLDTRHRDSSDTVERFLNEGRLVASLSHPNIVHVYDVGIAEGYVYLSMEYIEGGDLKSRLGKPFAPRDALEIICQVALGLDVAHRNGIVHRDVKPANILFRKDGTPVLSDFGIAKRLTVDQELTSTGVFLGSPNYMAPEQAQPGAIDGRADIYALGIILYEMLTGTKPYQSSSVLDVIMQHRNAPVPQLPAELATYQPLLNVMMAKNRSQRFRDCDSMVHFIRDLQRDQLGPGLSAPLQRLPVGAISTHTLGLTPTGRLRRRMPLWLTISLVMAAGFFLGVQLAAYWVQPANQDGPPQSVMRATRPVPPPPPPADVVAGDEVIQALIWLGKNSLIDYRLTDPPRDNAYYYFARLLQLVPSHPEGLSGMRQIAERFAVLAEREIARGDRALAREYVTIGLSLDAGNSALKGLSGQLVEEPESGSWWGWLAPGPQG